MGQMKDLERQMCSGAMPLSDYSVSDVISSLTDAL